MRRVLFLALAILGLCGISYAGLPGHTDRVTMDNGIGFPGFYTYPVAIGPYVSSVTCANIDVGGEEVRISTRASILHTVTISSGGLGNATFQAFDSYYSTGNSPGGSSSTPTVRELISPINATAVSASSFTAGGFIPQTFTYDIETSSGITHRNFGTVIAPCVTVTYTFKQ